MDPLQCKIQYNNNGADDEGAENGYGDEDELLLKPPCLLMMDRLNSYTAVYATSHGETAAQTTAIATTTVSSSLLLLIELQHNGVIMW